MGIGVLVDLRRRRLSGASLSFELFIMWRQWRAFWAGDMVPSSVSMDGDLGNTWDRIKTRRVDVAFAKSRPR